MTYRLVGPFVGPFIVYRWQPYVGTRWGFARTDRGFGVSLGELGFFSFAVASEAERIGR